MDVFDLLGEVRREARGASDDRMVYALVRAAREFCSATWIIRRSFEFNCVTDPATQRYPVEAPTNEQVIAIKHAQITAGGSVIPLQIVYSEYINPNFQSARPTGICFVPYTEVALNRVPDKEYLVKVETITQPVIDGQTVPDELGVRYDRALGYGALAWILNQRGNTWFEPNLAEQYRMKFNREITNAKREAAMDFSPGQHAWVRTPFLRRGYGGWSA